MLKRHAALIAIIFILCLPVAVSAQSATETAPPKVTLPQIKRPYLTFQPKMPPPARHLYAADVRKLSPDERLMLLSLQGLVNRKQPRIFLIGDDNDQFWLTVMQEQGHTDTPITVADPLSLVSMFRKEVQGAVISDPKIYICPNIAADVSGADDLLIATPELAAKYSLPIIQDLRGRFTDDADALRYVRTDLMPYLNPYLAICLSPDIMDAGAIDQIIAARGIAFWVTGPKAQSEPGANAAGEQAEVEKIMAQMPLNAVVRGFWWKGDGMGLDEGPGVSLASRYGKVTVVSDYVDNYSVLSGVTIKSLKQRPTPPLPKFDPTKVYIAITISDGDNLCTWRGYFKDYFTDPLHGTFPVGWGMGPTLLDLAPDMAEWYYNHAASTDEFICDVSGVGYIYPPDFAVALPDRVAALKDFYRWTETYLQRMDMKTLRLMNVKADDIAQVGALLPKVSFLMPDYGEQGEPNYSDFTYTLPTGQPAFRAMDYGSGPQNLATQVRNRIGKNRPGFGNVFILNWGSKLSDIKQMLDILGPDFVPVTPSQLAALYKESQAKR